MAANFALRAEGEIGDQLRPRGRRAARARFSRSEKLRPRAEGGTSTILAAAGTSPQGEACDTQGKSRGVHELRPRAKLVHMARAKFRTLRAKLAMPRAKLGTSRAKFYTPRVKVVSSGRNHNASVARGEVRSIQGESWAPPGRSSEHPGRNRRHPELRPEGGGRNW